MHALARRLSGEAAKFTAVNAVATVVAIVLFNLLVHGVSGLYRPGPLNGWPVSSWFLANCVGMVISYFGSRHYAFRQRRPSGPAGGAVRYAVVNLASFVIPMACLWISRNLLHLDSALVDNVSANVVGSGLGMVFRFWAFRRFVFRHPPHRRKVPPSTLAWLEAVEEAEDAAGEMEGSASGAGTTGRGPEVGPHVAELVQHQPQQRQAEADDVVRIAGHAGDEGTAEAVEGERPRHG